MKKIFLLSSAFLMLISHLFTQSDPWIMEVSGNDQLGKIVHQVTSRGFYLIAYPPQLSDLSPQTTGRVSANSLEELLTTIFAGKLEIKQIDDNKYLLRNLDKSSQPEETNLWITGRVIDQEHSGIPDILIYQDEKTAVISDGEGYFSLNIQPDKKEEPVFFQGLGYRLKMVLPDRIGKEFNIELEDQPVQIPVITVLEKLSNHNEVDKNGIDRINHKISDNQMLSYLYSSDLIKHVQFLPGVQADDDLSARIKIRGSQGSESLVLMDGIPVYHTDHFYGIFSVANGNYLTSGTLYKNALPIQYGGRTGGLLLLHSPTDVNRFSGMVEADLLAGSVALSVPVSNQLSINLGGRTSWPGIIERQGFDPRTQNTGFYETNLPAITRNAILNTVPEFNFSEINAKMIFRPSSRLHVDYNVFSSTDRIINHYDLMYGSPGKLFPATTTEVYRNEENWSNLGSSINLQWHMKRLWQLHGNTYYSSYFSNTSVSSLLTIRQENQNITSGFSNNQESEIHLGGGHLYIQRKSDVYEMIAGTDIKINRVSYRFAEDDITLLTGDDPAQEYTLFAENTWRQNKFSLTAGSRITWYSPAREIYFDPKFSATFQANKVLTFKTSVHLAHQYLRELNYENRLGQSSTYLINSNESLYPVGKSLQLMTGFSYRKNAFRLDVELYSKNLEGVLDYSLRTPGFRPGLGFNRSRSYQVFTGDGRVTGIDILMEAKIRRYSGWLAYTLSKSTRRFREIRFDTPFPAEDDRRHQLKWINSYSLGKLTLSANFIFSSGKPYLAIHELPGEIDRSQFRARSWLRHLPAYQRLDIGVDYRFNIFSKKSLIGVSCFNVTEHHNVKYLQYIFSIPGENVANRTVNNVIGTETSMLGRTPNLRFRIEL